MAKINTCLSCRDYVFKTSRPAGMKRVNGGVYDPQKAIIPPRCKTNDAARRKWFEKYGDIPHEQLTKEMELPCFRPNKDAKILDRAISLSEKILEKLNRNENP